MNLLRANNISIGKKIETIRDGERGLSLKECNVTKVEISCLKEKRMKSNYKFNISLSVLNHLGRNLYRNIITVIGEAISNSWDADANNVWITIDRENNRMSIKDDGEGMSDKDFQEKFLKIGYSKRINGNSRSNLNRPFIGRKGIGKLALLSCAQKIHIASRKIGGEVVGGVINNLDLDKAITDDLNSQDYIVGDLNVALMNEKMDNWKGTCIVFEDLKNGIFNTINYIEKAIALYFRFSLIDKNFNIYVNGKLIDEKTLSDLAENTQFVWKINDIDDPFLIKAGLNAVERKIYSKMNIRGYIASVRKPSDLKIRGTKEKVTIDLFVNGRLREKDILRHVPTTRIVENYVYGQIHYDDLDNGNMKDIFTSSREGIMSDEPAFEKFKEEFQSIFKKIMEEWDSLRRNKGDDGDPDNKMITPKARKAEELFNTTVKDLLRKEHYMKKDNRVENWISKLSEEAQYNIPSYTECFISENLLREYIKYKKLSLSEEAICEAKKWKQREEKNKGKANISYDIRISDDDIYYLDMTYLSNFVDKSHDPQKEAALGRSAILYKPVRDAVGHTSVITTLAKQQLSIEFENIKARLINLLKEM